MDLMDLTPKEDTIVVTLKHPARDEVLKNDDDSNMTITVYSPFSKEYKKVLHEQANLRLKKLQDKGTKEISYEEIEESSYMTLVKTTKSWNITFGGEKPKLTEKKAREVYEKAFWIKAQIEKAIDDSLDFMKA